MTTTLAWQEKVIRPGGKFLISKSGRFEYVIYPTWGYQCRLDINKDGQPHMLDFFTTKDEAKDAAQRHADDNLCEELS